MTYSIEKDFAFSASHVLEGLPEGHQCGRLHGHNYVVRLRLSGARLLPVGFLYDYGNLAPFKEHLDAAYDHRHLNDFMTGNPTAEHMAHVLGLAAMVLLKDLPNTVHVACGVSETPKTWAWWTS